MIYRLEMRPHQSFAEAEVLGDGDYLVQAVEQVAEAGPLQGRSRVERVEAGGEGVVALLQHGLQQREGLTQIPCGSLSSLVRQLSIPSDSIFFRRLRVFPTHSASLLDSSTTALVLAR